MKNNLFICECGSMEHQFIVSFDQDKDWNKYVYVHIHLNNGSFFRRLKNAVKYLFGYKCKYGCFDEVLLDKPQTKKLNDILDSYHNLME